MSMCRREFNTITITTTTTTTTINVHVLSLNTSVFSKHRSYGQFNGFRLVQKPKGYAHQLPVTSYQLPAQVDYSQITLIDLLR